MSNPSRLPLPYLNIPFNSTFQASLKEYERCYMGSKSLLLQAGCLRSGGIRLWWASRFMGLPKAGVHHIARRPPQTHQAQGGAEWEVRSGTSFLGLLWSTLQGSTCIHLSRQPEQSTRAQVASTAGLHCSKALEAERSNSRCQHLWSLWDCLVPGCARCSLDGFSCVSVCHKLMCTLVYTQCTTCAYTRVFVTGLCPSDQ